MAASLSLWLPWRGFALASPFPNPCTSGLSETRVGQKVHSAACHQSLQWPFLCSKQRTALSSVRRCIGTWNTSLHGFDQQRSARAAAGKKKDGKKQGRSKAPPSGGAPANSKQTPEDSGEEGGLWGTSNEAWSFDDMDDDELEALFDELDAELENDPNIRIEGERILEGLEDGSIDGNDALEKMAELFGRSFDELGLEIALKDDEADQQDRPSADAAHTDDGEVASSSPTADASLQSEARAAASIVEHDRESLHATQPETSVGNGVLKSGQDVEVSHWEGRYEKGDTESDDDEFWSVDDLDFDEMDAIFDELDEELEGDPDLVVENGVVVDTAGTQDPEEEERMQAGFNNLAAQLNSEEDVTSDDEGEPSISSTEVLEDATTGMDAQTTPKAAATKSEPTWGGEGRVAAEVVEEEWGSDDEEEKDSEEEEDGELEESDSGPLLAGWQTRKLRRALEKAGGNRKLVQVKWLAGETRLDRKTVLEWLKNPPEESSEKEALPEHRLKVTAESANSWAGTDPLVETLETEEDEDDEDEADPVKERPRWGGKGKRIKREHLDTLERVYQKSQQPSREMIHNLVTLTHMPRKSIIAWFQERRGVHHTPSFSQRRRMAASNSRPVEPIEFIGPDDED